MKKILVAFVAVAMAAAANAAAFAWDNPYGLDAYNQGNDTAFAAGTIYLMAGDSAAQSAFIAAVLGAADYEAAFNDQVASAVSSGILTADGAFNDYAPVEFDGPSAYNYFQVMVDTTNKGIYISELLSGDASDVGTNPLDFYNDAAYAGTMFGDTVTSFQGAGWYTAAAIPEPTSGLLMLLGMAGLALRRRRA